MRFSFWPGFVDIIIIAVFLQTGINSDVQKIRIQLQNHFDPIVKTYHRKKLAQILWCINNKMNNEIAVVVDDNVIWFEDEMRPPRKLGWDAIFSGE